MKLILPNENDPLSPIVNLKMTGDSDDHKIEDSRLSCKVRREGVEIEIHIYRMAGSDDGWTLEVVDPEWNSTVWDESFESDQAALDEAIQTIDAEGISIFLRPPENELH